MKQTKHIIAIVLFAFLLAVQNASGNYLADAAQVEVKQAVKNYDFTAFVNGQQLQIDFETVVANDVEVELFDITGKKIVSKKIAAENSKNKIIDLDQPLKKGVYIVKIKIDQKIVAKKIQT